MTGIIKRVATYFRSDDQPTNPPKEDTVNTPNLEDLKSRLTSQQFDVTQNGDTERAFTGEYHDTKTDGMYHCVVCGEPLFASDTKFDSGSGWPSFWQPAEAGAIALESDGSFGMVRTEAMCASCGGHLGHVFDDGPNPTGQRYCINSASIKLDSDEDG